MDVLLTFDAAEGRQPRRPIWHTCFRDSHEAPHGAASKPMRRVHSSSLNASRGSLRTSRGNCPKAGVRRRDIRHATAKDVRSKARAFWMGMRLTEFGWHTSIHDRRRRAPLHYWSKANNARLAARVICDAPQELQASSAEAIGYGDSPFIALNESFRRECSIALELIIKAVIAQRVELGIANKNVHRVPHTHDLISLWGAAELGPLSTDDRHTLLIARRILKWSGRYAAPKDDQSAYRDDDEEQRILDAPAPPDVARARKWRTIDWEQFDRVYGIASSVFWTLRRELEGRPFRLDLGPLS